MIQLTDVKEKTDTLPECSAVDAAICRPSRIPSSLVRARSENADTARISRFLIVASLTSEAA
jgi:hypothetical protein